MSARHFLVSIKLALLFTLWICACQSTGTIPIEPTFSRGIVVRIVSINPDSLKAPLAVKFSLSLSGNEGDVNAQDMNISSIAFDFGDSTGIVDVKSSILPYPYGIVEHTYTEPGTYNYRLKVSYNDGEILFYDSENLLITVLPAEDS